MNKELKISDEELKTVVGGVDDFSEDEKTVHMYCPTCERTQLMYRDPNYPNSYECSICKTSVDDNFV